MKNRIGRVSIGEVAAICALMVLIAIVISPAVTKSLATNSDVCMRNLGHLGRAFKLYVADSGGVYPHGAGCWEPNYNVGGLPDGDWVWFDGRNTVSGPFVEPAHPWSWRINPSKGSMWRYTDKNPSSYICPDDPMAANPTATKYGGFGLSYGINSALVENESAYGDTAAGSYTGGIGGGLARQSQLVDPNATVLLCELHMSSTCMAIDGEISWFYCPPTARHSGGGNFVFCDGHSAWVAAENQRQLAFFRDGRPGSAIYRPYDAPTNP